MKILTRTVSLFENKPGYRPIIRLFTSRNNAELKSAVAATDTGTSEWNRALPYLAIPGPKPLPIPKIGNAWRFFIGEAANLDMVEQQMYYQKKYGNIVLLRDIGRPDIIFLYDPVYAEIVFRNESVWPIRPGLDTMKYYRETLRKDIFEGNAGLIHTQGKEWADFRTKVNQTMMQPRNAKLYVEPIDSIAEEFVGKIRRIRNNDLEMPKDFSTELNKWALESIAFVVLDARLGCLQDNLEPDSKTNILINAVHEMFDLIYKLDVLPSPWKLFPTPNFKKLMKINDIITNITLEHIEAKMKILMKEKNREENKQPSILEILLLREDNR